MDTTDEIELAEWPPPEWLGFYLTGADDEDGIATHDLEVPQNVEALGLVRVNGRVLVEVRALGDDDVALVLPQHLEPYTDAARAFLELLAR